MSKDSKCTYAEHNEEPIQGFCLNLQCQTAPQCCKQCFTDKHTIHKNDCKTFIEIKKMIQNYQNQLVDWKKRLDASEIFDQYAMNYLENENQIMIELSEGMKVKCYQALNSKIQRVKLWNNHYTIGSKITKDNPQQYLQKLSSFQQQMLQIDNQQNTVISGSQIQQNVVKQQQSVFTQKEKIVPPTQNQGLAEEQKKKGLSLLNSKLYTDAIKCFDAALNINPNQSDVYVFKGDSLHELQKYEEAIQCYDKAIDINPKFILSIWKKGNTLELLKLYDQAIDCYDLALSYDPNFFLANYDKGNLLNQLENYKAAIECFDLALEAHPKYTDAFLKKGQSLNKMDYFDEAIECFDKALEIEPNFIKALFEKANTLYVQKKLSEALVTIKQILALDSKMKKHLRDKVNCYPNQHKLMVLG